MCSAKYIHAYHAIPLDNTIQCERFWRKRSLAECAGNLFNLTLAILSIFKSREAVIDRLRGLIKRVLQRIKVKKRPIVWAVINSVFYQYTSSGIIPPEHLTFVSPQGAHTICLCSRLLNYAKCTGFTVCFTYQKRIHHRQGNSTFIYH